MKPPPLSWRHRLLLQRMARSSAPILIGPWLSEIGFEVLYWLPFVAHLRESYQLSKDRLVAVTRGGAGIWYDTKHSIELYDYMPPEDMRLAMLRSFHQTKSVKQNHVTEWESALLPLLATRLGLRRYHVLHPSLMYQTLQLWWGSNLALSSVAQRLTMGPVRVPPVPPDLGLPEQYVAVKFYGRPTLPASDDLTAWAQDLVDRVSTKAPVVLLHTGLALDDHDDFSIKTGPRVLSLAGKVTPQNNLAVQSAVLAKARAFIGTYGGTMQLAVRLGIPAAGFFAVFKDTAYAHKVLTEYLGTNQRQPVFIGRPEDASFVSQCLSEDVR